MLTVVWREEGGLQSRADTLEKILSKRRLTAEEVRSAPRRKALKEFRSGEGWYRAADVDRLSEEEAGIIAERIIHRVHAKVPLTDEQIKAVHATFSQVFHRHFIDNPGRLTQEQALDELLAAARGHLSDEGFAALQESLAKGYRPQAGEK